MWSDHAFVPFKCLVWLLSSHVRLSALWSCIIKLCWINNYAYSDRTDLWVTLDQPSFFILNTIQHSDHCIEFPCYTPKVIMLYATCDKSEYVASNHNDKIRSCNLFIFIAQFWPHWKPQTAQKNSASPRSSIYSSSIRITSPLWNKYEQIIPSFLLCVNYRKFNHTLSYYTVHDTFKHSDHVSFNCVEFLWYTPEVIACNNRTDLWATLDQPDNELSNFTKFYVRCDRLRDKLHQIMIHCMPNVADLTVYHIISMWHLKNLIMHCRW